ncbi:MAG: HAMP domain-containing histidine kinase [Parasporobacterium sp.]|nr:HAMP domain-containing histidine kinase [Parasporobacterium sp.]
MNEREIHNLNNRFIVVAMLSIFAAMLFIGVAVNGATFVITRNSVDRVLNVMADNPEADFEDYEEYQLNAPTIEEIFSPEFRYNQLFLYIFDSKGRLLEGKSNVHNSVYVSNVSKIAEVTLSKRGDRGHEYNFFYKRQEQENGMIVVAMVEGSDILAAEYRLLYITLALGFFGMLITFFLVRHFSERAIQPAIEANKRQKEFITNASHELKTPLAVIRANTEMLEVLEGENEWTESTLRQVDHLTVLIQNLVMIAKSQEKENKSELSQINASKVVSETIDPYGALASQSGKTIERSIQPDIMITAEESKVRQLTSLLIDNAIKYCDEGGKIRVELDRIRSGIRSNGLRLAVSNDYAEGKDIDCSHFFDRFYREDQSHNQDKGGYGIGLSIAESITRQYKGSIEAKWEDGVISFICILK